MSDVRLIDANALIKKFEDDGLGDHSLIESVLAAGVYAGIENAPTIDAVEVVRCRECKYMRPLEHDGFVACIMWCRAMHSNGFCYEGRKKDEKDIDVPTKDKEE